MNVRVEPAGGFNGHGDGIDLRECIRGGDDDPRAAVGAGGKDAGADRLAAADHPELIRASRLDRCQSIGAEHETVPVAPERTSLSLRAALEIEPDQIRRGEHGKRALLFVGE